MTTAPVVNSPSTDIAAQAPAIELINAARWYGNVVAVNDITFSLDRESPGSSGRTERAKRPCSTCCPASWHLRPARSASWV